MTENPNPTQPPTGPVRPLGPKLAAPTDITRLGWLLPVLLLLLIITGTILLITPYATPHIYDAILDRSIPAGEPITISEALFTATSAVCLTGLTVRDTTRGFTPFGQAVIAALIQLGALCIITFGSVLALRISQSMSLQGEQSQCGESNAQPRRKIYRFIRFIFLATIAIELIGAAVIYPMWVDPADGALTFTQRAGMSLFHTISAFCNAGFDITGHSLVGYRYALLTHAVILPLIVVGGLGFPALENIFSVARARLIARFRSRAVQTQAGMDTATRKLTLHTKVVLTATACLYLLGVVTIGAGQMTPYMHDSMQLGVTAHADSPDPLALSTVGGILADASFVSITSRTAGFNAMPMDELQPTGRFSVMMLMLAGGSPGSAAGGLKTTAIALLVLSTVATLRQRSHAKAFGRTIADIMIRKALAIGVCYLLLVTLSTLLLCLVEPFSFQSLLFETISASTNTGLSLGMTPDLTGVGRMIILVTMFLGRVGPLVLLIRMALPQPVQQADSVAQGAIALG